MYCKNCGNDIGDSKFCPNCGQNATSEANAALENSQKRSEVYEKYLATSRIIGLTGSAITAALAIIGFCVFIFGLIFALPEIHASSGNFVDLLVHLRYKFLFMVVLLSIFPIWSPASKLINSLRLRSKIVNRKLSEEELLSYTYVNGEQVVKGGAANKSAWKGLAYFRSPLAVKLDFISLTLELIFEVIAQILIAVYIVNIFDKIVLYGWPSQNQISFLMLPSLIFALIFIVIICAMSASFEMKIEKCYNEMKESYKK